MITRRSFVAAASTVAALTAASAWGAIAPRHATRVLSDGIYFGDDPRWHDGRLWFSDFYAHAVKSVSPAGDLRTEVAIDDQPSGLGWLPDGSLLIVAMFKRQVLRRFPNGKISVHADLNAVAGFHCNDMLVDAEGRAYVGNFGFDLNKDVAARGWESVIAENAPAKLACVAPDGTIRVVADGLHFPNGTVITPDGKTMIIAETLAERLTAFDVGADGSLTNRRIWAQVGPRSAPGATPVLHRLPDGIALNAAGEIWVANAAAPECVLFAPGGAVRDVIETGDPCFACMLGGADGRTLFLLTAPPTATPDTSLPPKGKLLVTTVDSPRAGLP